MPSTIVRSGRERAVLAAAPSVVADVLSDPVAVTAMLGDLLDQQRSDAGPPARWAIPRIHLGLATFDTVLLPRFERDGDQVRIDAVTTGSSDAGARLGMDLTPTAVGPDRSELSTVWRLELRVPLPRMALRLAAPALDATVATTVRQIMDRTREAVEET